MNMYRVRITAKALSDMEAIYDYIALELLNPDAAMGQYNRIADAIETLSEFPERFKVFDSRPERDIGMRQIVIDNYSAIYVIRGEDVVVLRVLYGASNIRKRLLEYR